MSQFLFVVEVPPTRGVGNADSYDAKWTAFVSKTDTLLRNKKNCTRLQLNAWLFDVEDSWTVLDSLVGLAKDRDFPYSIVLIPDGAQILTPPYKP